MYTTGRRDECQKRIIQRRRRKIAHRQRERDRKRKKERERKREKEKERKRERERERENNVKARENRPPSDDGQKRGGERTTHHPSSFCIDGPLFLQNNATFTDTSSGGRNLDGRRGGRKVGVHIHLGPVLLKPFDGLFGNHLTVVEIDSLQVLHRPHVVESGVGYVGTIVQLEHSQTLLVRTAQVGQRLVGQILAVGKCQ